MTLPLPLQRSQGVSISLPLPPQLSQVRMVCITPNRLFCWTLTWPLPPQVGQVLEPVPGFAPLPLQTEQTSSLL